MSEHTEGPWIAGKEIQLDDDGIQTVPIFGPEGPGFGRVGTAYAEIGRDNELWPNARLQAAATELYEKGRELLLALETYDPDIQVSLATAEAFIKLREAIVKAETT